MMLRLPLASRAEPVHEPMADLVDGLDAPAGIGTMGLRLIEPADTLAPCPPARQFRATILLEESWQPDVEAIAATLATRFPTIGRIEVPRSRPGEAAGVIAIDGARVSVHRIPGRVPAERFAPPLKILRRWDPEDAIRCHAGAIEITCGGDLPGLVCAEAYAAAVHFTVTAACQVARATAVLWREGWVVSEPGAFADGAEQILAGRMPLGTWVSFSPVVPRGLARGDATGMVTCGMRPFIGRELELSPRPGAARDARRCLSRIARMVLDRGVALEDGRQLIDPDGGFAVTVRERSFWLRRDLSTYVLVSDDSVADIRMLKAETEVA